MFERFGNLVYMRDLLRELVVRDIKLRYKRSVLGIAWSLLNPLVQLLVFNFIFSLVLPLDIPNYALFVFIGLLSWTWFQASLFQAASAIVDNPDLVRHPGFPAGVLPIVTVSTHFIHFLLALPIVLVFLLLGRGLISFALLVLPLVILIQFLFSLSLSYGAAALHVTFRDTQYLLGIVLTLAFYLTPIFYDPSFIPERLRILYNLNPMVHLVEAYRAILLRGEAPEALPLILVGLLSLLVLVLTYSLFSRSSDHFVEEL
jgi:lipopolysaccharide transport system permease protein